MDKLQRNTKRVIIISNCVFGFLVVPALGMIRVMYFVYVPDSDIMEHVSVILFGLSIITYPIIYILSVILSWIFYSYKSYRAAKFSSFLPVLNLVAYFGFILVGMIMILLGGINL